MSMSSRAALTLLIALTTFACSTNGPTTVQNCDDENGIREAVFRYQFLNNSSAAQQSVDVYFLSLAEETDPEERQVVELPFEHEIYHSYYDFPTGPPKIHEHDNKPPRGYAVILDGRVVVYFLV